jgi:hypothetical protein
MIRAYEAELVAGFVVVAAAIAAVVLQAVGAGAQVEHTASISLLV